MARWKATGLVPGARVRMRKIESLDDVFELEVAGHRVVTGSEGLEGVLVEVHGGSGRPLPQAGAGTR